MIRRYVLSGCSGGGKSTLIGALAAAGYRTFAEPGRIIVAEELASGGTALPWMDEAAFARRAAAMSLAFFHAAGPGLNFYDRSLLEPLRWFAGGGAPLPADLAHSLTGCRYDDPVFLVPPWREIYVTDAERQRGFDAAVAEYEGLLTFVPAAGYAVEIVPHATVQERIALILERVEAGRMA